MSNHAHFLFLSPSILSLSKTMHPIQVSYAMYFNRRYGRSGHLFQDRFSSWVIADETHMYATKQYIEQNPVKAGLVTQCDLCKWSSAYNAEGDDPFITIEPIKG
jgi:putative transposase